MWAGCWTVAVLLAVGVAFAEDVSVVEASVEDAGVEETGVDVDGHGNTLLVLPTSWMPRGYLNPDDPQDVNPFRFDSGEQFLARADRYMDEIVRRRGKIDEAIWPRLAPEVRDALAAVIDQRVGRHRLLPRIPGERLEVLTKALQVAFTGGREAEKNRRPEFYERVVIVVDADEESGFEITEAMLGELDRVSRPGGLIPSLEIVLLPVSRLVETARGEGIRDFIDQYHLSPDPRVFVGDHVSRIDALVAERALEQALHDDLYRRVLLAKPGRRPRKDVTGTMVIGAERLRFALRDHDAGKELRPLADGILDVYRYRYPNLIGVPTDAGAATAHEARVRRIKDEPSAREYRIEVTVSEDHPGGPLVLRVPEFLDQSSTITRIEHAPPGEDKPQRIDCFLAGPRFVPKNLGYRIEEKRRESLLTLVPLTAGVHRFHVRVVGRRY